MNATTTYKVPGRSSNYPRRDTDRLELPMPHDSTTGRFTPTPPENRFWPKVNKDGPAPSRRPELGACWLWLAGKSDGYGSFRAEKMVRAHRWAYERDRGPVPAGLELDHLCRIRHCVNPAHLEPVTPLENIRRGESGQRTAVVLLAKPVCKWGHPRVEPNIWWVQGYRQCRLCSNERRRVRRAAARDRLAAEALAKEA